MNLIEVIHDRWAAASSLDDLLPASAVTTGLCVDPTMPYATIAKRGDRPVARLNDGSAVDAVAVRIEVFHDDRDAAAEIVAQIKTAFDRTEFALDGTDRVVNMQRVGDRERQHGDGTWQMTVDFACTVYLATGV